MTNRRALVPFDPDYFAKRIAKHGPVDGLTAFRHAHEHNLWHGPETRSGPGSSIRQTAAVVKALPQLCQRYQVRTLLDVPCGTFHWMARVDLGDIQYVGGDLLPEVVEEANRQYGTPSRRFSELDLTRSPLPDADLLLCRDCFVHMSYADIMQAMHNIRRSRLTYLLTTTFPAEPDYHEIVTGDWRPINLEAPPFSLPTPIELMSEECTEQNGAFADKSLGLWRVRDLPV